MPNRWAGPLIALGVVAGVAAFLMMNIESARQGNPAGSSPVLSDTGPPAVAPRAGFREYPIGEPQERSSLEIAAVWLPSVHLAGDGATADPNIVHLEADIHATQGNPNGFARDEFVPYLTVRYRVEPAAGGPALEGTMPPMVARDGLHYGAGLAMPGAGRYRLTYRVEPPASNGLGRHDDAETGVAPWWEPFDVSFDWDFQPATGG